VASLTDYRHIVDWPLWPGTTPAAAVKSLPHSTPAITPAANISIATTACKSCPSSSPVNLLSAWNSDSAPPRSYSHTNFHYGLFACFGAFRWSNHPSIQVAHQLGH